MQTSMGAADGLLLALAHELLDAHVDTVELTLDGTDDLRWQAHLDYLRALVRKAEEIVAQASGAAGATTAAAPRAEEGR